MTGTKLSKVQGEAILNARAAGALFRPGAGDWVRQDEKPQDGHTPSWRARWSTVDALVRAGFMVYSTGHTRAALTGDGHAMAVRLEEAARLAQVQVTSAGVSEQGPKSQQDDRWVARSTEHGALLAVMDGISHGGYGDVAAMTVERVLEKQAAAFLAAPVRDGKALLAAAFEEARLELDQVTGGTTVTALLVATDGRAWTAHAGDSALFRMRRRSGGTRDFRLWRGTEAHRLPGTRNVLVRYMGGSKRMLPEIATVPAVQPGDLYLLATDGCFEELKESQLVSLMQAWQEHPDEASRRLVDESLLTTRDNTTALVARVTLRSQGA